MLKLTEVDSSYTSRSTSVTVHVLALLLTMCALCQYADGAGKRSTEIFTKYDHEQTLSAGYDL